MSTTRVLVSSGVKWTMASQMGRQAIQLGSTVVLARLLSPADFGLLGMASVATGFVATFRSLGTAAAVVQRKDPSQAFLSSIHWMNVLFGMLSTFVLFAVAHPVAEFYGEPALAGILQFLSVTFTMTGITTVHNALMERALAFDRLAKIELGAALLGSLTGVATAAVGMGALSLAFQAFASTVASSAMLLRASRFRPSLCVRWSEIRSALDFSLNLTGFSLANYAIRNADNLLIGRFLGAQELGYYTLAYKIMLLPVQSIAGVVSRVMFAAYAEMQGDDARFRRVYLKVAGAIALVTFPVAGGLWMVARSFVHTFFGAAWTPLIALLMLLAPIGAMQAVDGTAALIYLAKGRTDWLFGWGLGAGAVALTGFALGLRWGIVGVAASYLITSALYLYPNFAIPFRLIGLRVVEVWWAVWRAFACTVLMVGALVPVEWLLSRRLPSVVVLVVLVLLGVVVYAAATLRFNRTLTKEVVATIGARVRRSPQDHLT